MNWESARWVGEESELLQMKDPGIFEKIISSENQNEQHPLYSEHSQRDWDQTISYFSHCLAEELKGGMIYISSLFQRVQAIMAGTVWLSNSAYTKAGQEAAGVIQVPPGTTLK